MNNYETELPHNYKLIKTIDAQKSSVGLVLNLIALAVIAAVVVGAYFIIGVPFKELFNLSDKYTVACGIGNNGNLCHLARTGARRGVQGNDKTKIDIRHHFDGGFLRSAENIRLP